MRRSGVQSAFGGVRVRAVRRNPNATAHRHIYVLISYIMFEEDTQNEMSTN